MALTIDELQIEIQASSQGATSSLDALTSSLSKLQTQIKGGIGLTTVTKQLQAFSAAIQSISAPTHKVAEFAASLVPLQTLGKSNLGSMLNQLKKIPAITESLDNAKLAEFADKIKQVTTAIQPLATEMEKVSQGFSKLPANIQKAINANAKLTASNKKLGTSFSSIKLAALLTNLKYFYNIAKKIRGVIGGWITESNYYQENLNLFTVAMGEYADSSLGYANTVSETMGIDVSDWIRNQGVFMTLASGFGVVADRAALMSKNLTQLGYDLSSFFNISVEDAMQKLQSGISGELEPLRRLGFDLSQSKLEAVALSLGIDKTVSSMTQAEKAQLRYYAIMTQVTEAQGDMARTLEAPANQLRILQAQLTMAARALGNIFIPLLNKVLPYLISFVKVVRDIADGLAEIAGFTLTEIDYSSLDTSKQTESFKDTEEAAEDLQNALMGFDEINNINSSASDVLGGGFSFELPEYEFLLEGINNKVDDIYNSLRPKVDWVIDNLQTIIRIVGVIGVGLLSWKIGSTFMDNLNVLSFIFSKQGLLLGGIVAVGAGLLYLYQTNDEFRASIDELFTTISGSLAPVFNYLAETVLPFVTDMFINLWTSAIVPLLSVLGEALPPILTVVVNLFSMLMERVIVPLIPIVLEIAEAVLPLLGEVFTEIIIPALEQGIEIFNFLWKNILSPLVGYIASDVIPFLSRFFDGVKTSLGGIMDFISGVFSGNWTKAWNGIKQVFIGVWESVDDIFKPIINGILSGVESFVNFFIKGINWIIEGLNKIQVKMPDWLGGKTFGININPINSVSIPRLATGGIVPANNPMLAVVGDNKSQKEAIAPIDDLYDMLVSAVGTGILAARGASSAGSGGERTTQVTLEINGTKIARALLPFLRNENERIGAKTVVVGG